SHSAALLPYTTLFRSVLNNLARVAMSRKHFDEAIDRAHVALDLSRSLGLKPLSATVLGNLGWSYFELGDFENALDSYGKGAQARSEEHTSELQSPDHL